jgi:hypothetical protein
MPRSKAQRNSLFTPFDKLRANGGDAESQGFIPFVVSSSNHKLNFPQRLLDYSLERKAGEGQWINGLALTTHSQRRIVLSV